MKKEMKYVDIAVSAVFVLALVVIYFFWGCEADLYIALLVGVVIAVSVATSHFQNKKLKDWNLSIEE